MKLQRSKKIVVISNYKNGDFHFSKKIYKDKQLVSLLRPHSVWVGRFCMGDDQLAGPCNDDVGIVNFMTCSVTHMLTHYINIVQLVLYILTGYQVK